MTGIPYSAAKLRRELSIRNLDRARLYQHEVTFGTVPNVVYGHDERGQHGNFLPGSYRRICADAAWRARLGKPYTASSRIPRSTDRQRWELDCASSSDALLMNIFCYPGALNRKSVCALLGIEPGLRPEFGVRARLAMRNGEVDRTELDMYLASRGEPLLFEAKLTEANFQSVGEDRLMRYESLADTFDVDELPYSARGHEGYQLIRGVLAAQSADGRFVLLTDDRRADLREIWFQTLRAVRSYSIRSRMALLTWQEISAAMPHAVQIFLYEKYGIRAEPSRR